MTATTAPSERTATVSSAELRARFALRLAGVYGSEVPAYTTLVEVATEVNRDVAAARPGEAERLGSIDRVTAERHGAIRVGTAQELAQTARVFAGFGMHPVGFYDLRDASRSSVPVVSTAFRPVDPAELARNPFRVFTSMLVSDDRRFFDADTQARLEEFLGARTLFGDELLELADAAAVDGGLDGADADRYLELATAAFELGTEPVDRDWYATLESISAVAADIGGVPSTHINHLTPRVLDIDDLYRRMTDRGIEMIEEIQGPPRWRGPDVLLRQTSFRALAEDRWFRHRDGSVRQGTLRVRFGEVEQRGLALTTAGRDLYDAMVAETDVRLAALTGSGRTRVEVAREVWEELLPDTEAQLAARDLAFFAYGLSDQASEHAHGGVSDLVEQGVLTPEPIVYEDFLPRSAAGIFQSNLTEQGTRDDAVTGTPYDLDRLSEVIGVRVADPTDLYRAQQRASLDAVARTLGLAHPLVPGVTP